MTSLERAEQSQETCPNVLQLMNAREKVFRPQWEFFLPKKIPSLSLSPSRGRRGDGILSFQINLECAGNPDLSGATALSLDHHTGARSKAPSPLRSAGALQIYVVAIVAMMFLSACSRTKTSDAPGSSSQTREVTDEAGRRVRLPEK